MDFCKIDLWMSCMAQPYKNSCVSHLGHVSTSEIFTLLVPNFSSVFTKQLY